MPDNRDLRNVLRDEAERHLPDRAAMLGRIDERRATAPNRLVALFRPVAPGPRRALNVLRPVAAAVAVAGVLVAGITGINMAGGAPDPVSATPMPPVAPSISPSTVPSRKSTAEPPKATHRSFLTATASLNPYSIDNWGQSDLVLATTGTITALDVTVRIAKSPGLRSTGKWTSIPAELITVAESSTKKDLVYRFTLKPGATLAPGSYTFAAQYNHAAGARSMSADSYEATATAGKTAHVEGDYLD
ncbi:hypothetical protein [Actinoplanes sp. NPDC026619]|uniref:hypothetical protein n=1 Tax=Actinoplanes sp. NPDC026619 TaxID=3155798 RepID=UPI0033E63ECC